MTGLTPNREDKTGPSLQNLEPASGNSRTVYVYCELRLIKSKGRRKTEQREAKQLWEKWWS